MTYLEICLATYVYLLAKEMVFDDDIKDFHKLFIEFLNNPNDNSFRLLYEFLSDYI